MPPVFVRRISAAGLLLLCAGLLPQPSLAATTPSPLILEQQRQQQKAIENEIQRRLRIAPSPGVPSARAETAPLLERNFCQVLKSLWLYGADHLPKKNKLTLFAPYKDRCIDNAGLKKLAQSIQNWYLQAGYITTRVKLKRPQSSLNRGNLEIWVIEGYINRFLLNHNRPFDQRRIATAFPVSRGDILNIHDLDQGLEQLNRLFSQTFRMQIKPAERTGYSDILLLESNTETSLLDAPLPSSRNIGKQQLSYRYSNGGQQATGPQLHNLSFSRENLFGVNDVLSYSRQRAMPRTTGITESDTERAGIRLPWGYWNADFNYYHGRTLQQLTGAITTFRSRSNITTRSLRINRVLLRDQRSKLGVFLSMEDSKRENYINQTLVQVASRRIASLELGLSYTRYFNHGSLLLIPSLSRGLPWLNSLQDSPAISADQPHAEYQMYKFYGAYSHVFGSNRRRPFSLSTTFNLQYSNRVLYGEKRFIIGGEYSVRGFHDNAVSDDRGLSWRNDLDLPVGRWFSHHRYLQPFNLKLFADMGISESAFNRERNTLAGWGYGIEYRYRWFDFYYQQADALRGEDLFSTAEGWVRYYGAHLKLTF